MRPLLSVRNTGYYFSWQSAKFCKIDGTLWNFNMEVKWENLKCGISQKRLIVERNGQKFGTWGTTVHVYRVFLMPDSLSLGW